MSEQNGNIRVINIEDIAEADAFKATGYAYLKVVRQGATVAIRVEITSVPQDVIDDVNKRAPKPPAKTLMIDPQSDEGRRLNITGTGRQRVIVPDYSDPLYQEKRDAHDQIFRQEIVGRGVSSNLKLKDGKMAETPQERYRALEERELSGLHFAELAESILKLTSWSEEERANFSMPSSASKEN